MTSKLPKALTSASGLGLWLLAALLPASSRAAQLSIEVLSGASTLHMEAGDGFSRDGGFGFEARPQINLEFPSFNGAFFASYQGRFGSNFGTLPLSRTGVGVQYYPRGMSLRRTVTDNGVVMGENRFAPFLLAQLDLAAIAVTDTSSAQQSFNALTIGYQLGGGAELPLTPNESVVVMLTLDGTLSGGASSSVTGVNFRAYALMVGIALHP